MTPVGARAACARAADGAAPTAAAAAAVAGAESADDAEASTAAAAEASAAADRPETATCLLRLRRSAEPFEPCCDGLGRSCSPAA